MIEATLGILTVIAICLIVVRDFWRDRQARVERTEAEIRSRLHDADAEVSAEHGRARRAMNKAAGQAWRNLIE